MMTSWNQQNYSACEPIPVVAPRAPPAARALVIGGDDCAQRWTSGRLREGGFEVSACSDGREALDTAHGDPPDLVILDRVTPHEDARFVLHELRHDPRTRDVPILVLASSATRAVRGMCRRLDASLVVMHTCEPGLRVSLPVLRMKRRRRTVLARVFNQRDKRGP